MHIACVEDNPVKMALVLRVAGMTKHTIASFSEGEVAQLELMNQKFDLILMDVELAGEISGLQVVRSLRERGLRTPIIAMTAYAMAGDRDRCLEAGCDDYLAKPITIADLLRLLSHYSDLTDREKALQGSDTPAALPPSPTLTGKEKTADEPVPQPNAAVSGPEPISKEPAAEQPTAEFKPAASPQN